MDSLISVAGLSFDDRDGDLVHQVVNLLLKQLQNFLSDEQVGLVQILETGKSKFHQAGLPSV